MDSTRVAKILAESGTRIRKVPGPTPRFSAVDFLMSAWGCSRDSARLRLRLQVTKQPGIKSLFVSHKFWGRGQNKTPIATASNLQKLMNASAVEVDESGHTDEGVPEAPAKRQRVEPDDLYIMRYSTNQKALKIGRSNDVQRRKRDLEGGHNFFMEVVAVFPGKGALERCIHARLKDKRSHIGAGTEWFNVSVTEAMVCIGDSLEISARFAALKAAA